MVNANSNCIAISGKLLVFIEVSQRESQGLRIEKYTLTKWKKKQTRWMDTCGIPGKSYDSNGKKEQLSSSDPFLPSLFSMPVTISDVL